LPNIPQERGIERTTAKSTESIIALSVIITQRSKKIMSTIISEKRVAIKKHSGYIRTVPLDTRRRIGSTVYNVAVFTKENTGDTVEEKVLRLVRNDLNITHENVKIKIPQTERLPERSSL